MFFGMTNAPAVFQRTMDRIFAVLKNKYPGCIFVYMDDILIATPDDEELHAEIVNAVLDMLATEDFFLKLSKCSFHQRTVSYLGIQIEGGIIRIDPTKHNGLATWKEVLDDVHNVRSTLGVTTFPPFTLPHVYLRLSSPNPIRIPRFVSHVTLPSTIMLPLIITC